MADRNYEEDFDYYDAFQLIGEFEDDEDDELFENNDDLIAVADTMYDEIDRVITRGDRVMLRELVDGRECFHGFDGMVLATVMLAAASDGRLDILQHLKEQGVKLNARGEEGDTLLMRAAASGHARIVDWLLENHSPVERQLGQSESPLICAAEGGFLDIVIRLFSVGRFEPAEIDDALSAAAYCGQKVVFDYLFPHASSISQQEATADLEVGMRRASRLHAPATDDVTTFLLIGAAASDARQMSRAIANDAQVNAADDAAMTALEYVVHDDALIRMLLKAGADPNTLGWEDGDSVLMRTVAEDNLAGARLLLKAGADPNHTNDRGETALSWAIDCGATDMVALLARAGADLGGKDVGEVMRQANRSAAREAREVVKLGRLLASAIGKPNMLLEFDELERKLDTAQGAGLIMSPDSIQLVPTQVNQWYDEMLVTDYRAIVESAGFEPIGVYDIQGLDDVRLCSYYLPRQSLYATVYEHPATGVWIDLVTRYRDQTAVTYTDIANGAELARPPWSSAIYLPGTGVKELIARCLAERDPSPKMTQDARHFQADFEESFRREVAWRTSHASLARS